MWWKQRKLFSAIVNHVQKLYIKTLKNLHYFGADYVCLIFYFGVSKHFFFTETISLSYGKPRNLPRYERKQT